MFRDDAGTSDWIFGTVVTVAVVAVFVFIRSQHHPAVTLVPIAEQPRVEPPKALPSPTLQIRNEIPGSSERTIARVYECVRDEQRVLSDQPCGSGVTIREVSAPNRADAQDTSILYRSSQRPIERRESRSGGSVVISNKRVCDSVEAQIDRINARMRQLYTNQEGERFRERLRRLSESRWEAGCGR